ALAAAGHDVLGHLVDQHHVGRQPPPDQGVDGGHVLGREGLDLGQRQGGAGRGGLGAGVHVGAGAGGRQLYGSGPARGSPTRARVHAGWPRRGGYTRPLPPPIPAESARNPSPWPVASTRSSSSATSATTTT